MTGVALDGSAAGSAGSEPRGLANALLKRQLQRYPSTGRRYAMLAIVVATTIVLYYLYYVEGSITPLMLPYYHMSFLYFLYLLVVSNAVGAFTAFIGGISDRIGRANLAIYGVLAVGLIQLVAVPNIHSEFGFAIAYVAIGFVEGIILVVTPALIRDFSPQMGRASAMGFWALGPTLGSLVASLVAEHTLPHLAPWQDQFIISGTVCMVMFAIAFVWLRELAPGLRDQLMVSLKERALVEARARGLDVEAAIAHPLRSMMRLDLLSSSVAISLFLLIYYASVSVLTIYWVVVFNQSTANANGINVWYWGFDAAMLVIVGVVSDRLRVRKPFMLIGAVGAIVMTLVFISKAHEPTTSYYTLVAIVSALGIFIAFSYTPWMAAYTEAVEAHNPALSATGLAVWGWVLRIVVAASFLVLPHVITTATTLVDHQNAATDLKTLEAASSYVPGPGNASPPPLPASLATQLDQIGPPGQALADFLQHRPLPASLAPQLTGLLAFKPAAALVQKGEAVTPAMYLAVAKSSPQLASLLHQEELIIPAQKASPDQWVNWWWVCLAGEAIFLLLVFNMKGRWSPRAARRDFEEREAMIATEMARIHAAGAPGPVGTP